MPAGTKEQLAAAIVDGADSAPGPQLEIYGRPGNWSVCVHNRPDDAAPLWLGTARQPTVIRCFKTLDAAILAASAVEQTAKPDNPYAHQYHVRVVMDRSEQQ